MIQHPFRSIVLVLLLAWTACGWLQAGFAYVYDIVYLDTMGRTSGQAYRINNSNGCSARGTSRTRAMWTS